MRRSPRARALAGAALLALALGGIQPAGAQVTQPGQPTTTNPAPTVPTVAPAATPRPAISPGTTGTGTAGTGTTGTVRGTVRPARADRWRNDLGQP